MVSDIYQDLNDAGLYSAQVEEIRGGPYTEKYLRKKLDEYLWEEKHGRRPISPGWLLTSIRKDVPPSREYQRAFSRVRAGENGELDERGRKIRAFEWGDEEYNAWTPEQRKSLCLKTLASLRLDSIPVSKATHRQLFRAARFELRGDRTRALFLGNLLYLERRTP